MEDIIIFNDSGYDRMHFINLICETEEIKWKILEFHNQEFLLDKIGGGVFTREGHMKFLNELPRLERKHYIVYFDDRAVGKYGFKFENNCISDLSNYLFFETDLMSGIGLLMRVAFFKYVFEVLNVDKITYKVLKTNKSTISLSKKTGAIVVGEENDMYCYEVTNESYFRLREKLDSLVKFMFT